MRRTILLLSSQTPLFLLIAIALSLVLMLVIQSHFYISVFAENLKDFSMFVGISFAVLVQLVRFAVTLSSVDEILKSKFAVGFISLAFSFCLTLFEHYEVSEISAIYESSKSIDFALKFVVWVAFFLEIRLALNLTEKKKDVKKSVQKLNGKQILSENLV